MLIRVLVNRLIFMKIVITVIILRDIAKLINGLIHLFSYSFVVQSSVKVADSLFWSMPENMSCIVVNHAVQFPDNCSETCEIIQSFVVVFVILTLLFTIFGQNL